MENNKESSALSMIIMFLITPVLVFLLMVNAAYPAMKVWNLWMPSYFGLPLLTLPYSVMLILTVSLFTVSKTSRSEDNRTKATKNNDILMSILAPWIVYAVAYCTYKFFII